MNCRGLITRLAVAASLTIGACTPAAPAGRSAPSVSDLSPSGAVQHELVLFPQNEAGAGAEIRGMLSQRGPCLYLVADNGESWLTAWPATARWTSGDRITFGASEVTLADVAFLGGGEVRIERSMVDDFEWVQPPDSSCLPALVWFVYTARNQS